MLRRRDYYAAVMRSFVAEIEARQGDLNAAIALYLYKVPLHFGGATIGSNLYRLAVEGLAELKEE